MSRKSFIEISYFLGQQSSQIWVLGFQVQFQPNGSPIPTDMITKHFSSINAIPAAVTQGKGNLNSKKRSKNQIKKK